MRGGEGAKVLYEFTLGSRGKWAELGRETGACHRGAGGGWGADGYAKWGWRDGASWADFAATGESGVGAGAGGRRRRVFKLGASWDGATNLAEWGGVESTAQSARPVRTVATPQAAAGGGATGPSQPVRTRACSLSRRRGSDHRPVRTPRADKRNPLTRLVLTVIGRIGGEGVNHLLAVAVFQEQKKGGRVRYQRRAEFRQIFGRHHATRIMPAAPPIAASAVPNARTHVTRTCSVDTFSARYSPALGSRRSAVSNTSIALAYSSSSRCSLGVWSSALSPGP